MRNIIDAIFGPVVDILNKIIEWLGQVRLIAAHGFDLGIYLGYVAWLPPPWLSLVKTVALGALLVAVVWAVRALWSLYLTLKSSVKWW
ncbi:hypothetical protein [Caldinitratiruptor microaerophilus]|uniref:Uncharacterized protein n=1 Tax=Caldinitratiruptor microaerophilus TaxID=671077 RepID=A0AA35CJJ1_9FIRM|nr:hypothetical protein [Caldinitratiruptor microaerophilus]BDG60277.1 hypothetical protein caldi_13670 [Caldinitratiruptor microaerophilus]